MTGIDISDVAIDEGLALARDREVTVKWVRGDFLEWDAPRMGYDLVLLSYLQLPPEKRQPAHAKAVSVVADDGRLLLIAHHAENIEKGVGAVPTTRLFCITSSCSPRTFKALTHRAQREGVPDGRARRRGEDGYRCASRRKT